MARARKPASLSRGAPGAVRSHKPSAAGSTPAPATKPEPASETPGVRRPTGQWTKGHSGNPLGYPKALVEVRELARNHTQAAIDALAAKLRDRKGAVVVAAAVALLDRGWGRPIQTVNGTSVTIPWAKLTPDQARRIADGDDVEEVLAGGSRVA